MQTLQPYSVAAKLSYDVLMTMENFPDDQKDIIIKSTKHSTIHYHFDNPISPNNNGSTTIQHVIPAGNKAFAIIKAVSLVVFGVLEAIIRVILIIACFIVDKIQNKEERELTHIEKNSQAIAQSLILPAINFVKTIKA